MEPIKPQSERLEIAPLFDSNTHAKGINCECVPIFNDEFLIHRRLDNNIDYRPIINSNRINPDKLASLIHEGKKLMAVALANEVKISFEIFMELMYVAKVLTCLDATAKTCFRIITRPESNRLGKDSLYHNERQEQLKHCDPNVLGK